MNRNDLKMLQSIRGYPAVSILVPTHRTHPDNQQDPIRVKSLFNQATDRLLKEFPRRDVDALLILMDRLQQQIDYRNTLDGLVVYIHKDYSGKFYLPFPVKERVAVEETFATRDLVFALNRSLRYWVLVLSEKPTRLFEATRDYLEEIKEFGFPMTHEGPGGSQSLPGGFGIRRSAHRDERHRQFFRQVDQAFTKAFTADPMPVVVVGVDRYIAFFNEVTQNKNRLLTTLTGSHDKTSASELAKIVWLVAKPNFESKRQAILEQLEAAIGARQSASGIGEVWRMTQEGRTATLLVDEDYNAPALINQDGYQITLVQDPSQPGVVEDIVDEVIEETIARQGQVVFFENGALEKHQRIAAILRY